MENLIKILIVIENGAEDLCCSLLGLDWLKAMCWVQTYICFVVETDICVHRRIDENATWLFYFISISPLSLKYRNRSKCQVRCVFKNTGMKRLHLLTAVLNQI